MWASKGSLKFKEGPLYPIAKLIHGKILGLFTRQEQTEILSRSLKNQGDHVSPRQKINLPIDIFTTFKFAVKRFYR